METAIAFSIGNELVTIFVILSTIMYILLLILVKVIIIYKVITSIVGWVDVYHFHLAQIVLSKQL